MTINPVEFTLGQQFAIEGHKRLPKGCSESFKRGWQYQLFCVGVRCEH